MFFLLEKQGIITTERKEFGNLVCYVSFKFKTGLQNSWISFCQTKNNWFTVLAQIYIHRSNIWCYTVNVNTVILTVIL